MILCCVACVCLVVHVTFVFTYSLSFSYSLPQCADSQHKATWPLAKKGARATMRSIDRTEAISRVPCRAHINTHVIVDDNSDDDGDE